MTDINFKDVVLNRDDYLNECLINHCKKENNIPDDFVYIPLGEDTACLDLQNVKLSIDDQWTKNIPSAMLNFAQYTMQRPINVTHLYDDYDNLIDNNHLVINPYEEICDVRCFLIPQSFDKDDIIKWKIKCGMFNKVIKLSRQVADKFNCMSYKAEICPGFNATLNIYVEDEKVIKTVPEFKINTKDVKSISDILTLNNLVNEINDMSINGVKLNVKIDKDNNSKVMNTLNLMYRLNQILNFFKVKFTNINEIDEVTSKDVKLINELHSILIENDGVYKEHPIKETMNLVFNQEVAEEIEPNAVYIFFSNGEYEYILCGHRIHLYMNQMIRNVKAQATNNKIEILHNDNSTLIQHYHIDKNKWQDEYRMWISSRKFNSNSN